MKIKSNYIYALISMTLVLFLAGVFGSMIIQSQQLVKFFKEQMVLIAELENGYTTSDLDSLQQTIAAKDYVKPNSIEFTSKEDAAKIMQKEFGGEEDFGQLGLVNPLYDVITFYVKADSMNVASLKSIAHSLKQDSMINHISYEENMASNMSSYWDKIGWIGLSISLILIIVAVFLIIYAVRQALYTDRFIIKNMHLVGATPSFITRPYTRKGVIGGLLSAVLACVGLLLVRSWIIGQVPEISEHFPISSLSIVFVLLLSLGIVITAGSAWFTVRQYLKSDVNELYK
jgi:cell division transport system permease protein